MTNVADRFHRRIRHSSFENSSLADSPLSVAALGFMMIAAVDFRQPVVEFWPYLSPLERRVLDGKLTI